MSSDGSFIVHIRRDTCMARAWFSTQVDDFHAVTVGRISLNGCQPGQMQARATHGVLKGAASSLASIERSP
jgi:hypothetical protein